MRRRKFELLLADLWRLIRDPERAEKDFALSVATWNLMDFTGELARDAAKTRELLEFTCALRSSNAVGRQVAEERIMANLVYLAGRCSESLQVRGLERLPGMYAIAGAAAKFQPMLQVVRVLYDYALGCFEFKRPRDSFGGRRRAIAFDLLARIGMVADLPEAVRLAQQSSRKVDSIEGRQAGLFLDEYLEERDLLSDDDWAEEVQSLAEEPGLHFPALPAPSSSVHPDAMSGSEARNPLDNSKRKRR